jgi:ABC-type dipeptide/oligopeptide/nickel transport system ATPase component
MNENERLIGKVIAVESDKVFIELEKDSKSLTKTFVSGTYPIARINSYVIIPVGSISIVGVVTRVSMANEQIEITHDATLSLPQPRRTISVSMVGTLEKDSQSKFKFSFGISQFPVLNNPVWFILNEELDSIFDKNENSEFFIEMGKSTAYPDYNVKFNPDKLFSRHLGILGNTGAGKSHTIATILQTILRNKNVKDGKGAHFIIFDTNGEYKQAFQNDPNFEMLHIDQESMRIPYWFMNFQDYRTLFQASEGTQIPILQQAILDSKNKVNIMESSITGLSEFILEKKSFFKRQKEKSKADWATSEIQKEINKKFDLYFQEFSGVEEIQINESEIDDLKVLSKKYTASKFLEELGKFKNEKLAQLKKEFELNILKTITSDEIVERNIPSFDVDSPHYFDIKEFRKKHLEQVLDEAGGNIRDKCSYLLLRIDKFINDTRYDFIFHAIEENGIDNALSDFLRLCFGRLERLDVDKSQVNDAEYFLNKYKITHKNNPEKNYQLIIFDLSLIPYDILQNVTALLGRLFLEFLQRIDKTDIYKGKEVRGKFPVVLVLEEAHNYIPNPKKEDEASVSREVFERIAREGRKYGLSLIISSQRPSELSRTVLSQCNSYIVHRIQNPEDQEYIKKLLPSISHDLLKQLPVLGQGIALIFGDCVRAPMQVYINKPSPTPKSSDPEFWNHWTKRYNKEENPFKNDEPDFEAIAKQWENGS